MKDITVKDYLYLDKLVEIEKRKKEMKEVKKKSWTVTEIAREYGSSVGLFEEHYKELFPKKIYNNKNKLNENEKQQLVKLHKDFLSSL